LSCGDVGCSRHAADPRDRQRTRSGSVVPRSDGERGEAARRGGWVRNRSDGTVELEAEGSDETISQLIAWCAQGPPSAEVSGVAVDELAVTGTDTMFAVVR
jgi:acylphosphatase